MRPSIYGRKTWSRFACKVVRNSPIERPRSRLNIYTTTIDYHIYTRTLKSNECVYRSKQDKYVYTSKEGRLSKDDLRRAENSWPQK